MNTTTRPFRSILAFAAALALTLLPAVGAPVTVTYNLPISMAGHGFVAMQAGEIPVSYLSIQTPNRTGTNAPIYDDAAYVVLTVQVQADGTEFWLHDQLLNADSVHRTATSTAPITINRPGWIYSDPPLLFAVDATHQPDDFRVFLDWINVLLPVTKSAAAQVTLPIANGGGTTATTYPFFNAHAFLNGETGYSNIYLVDVTSEEMGGAYATCLTAGTWGPLTTNIPVRSVTILLDSAEQFHAFTFHAGTSLTGIPHPEVGTVSSVHPPVTYSGVWFVGGTASPLTKYWLTRDADLASSAHILFADEVKDLRGKFPPLPPNEMHTVRLRLRADTRGGHVIRIYHAEGHPPEPLTFNATPDTLTQITTGGVSTSVDFFWAETEFDNGRAWWLQDDSTANNEVLFSTAGGYSQQVEKRARPLDVLDGWEPPHLAVAAGSRRFTLPASRRTHTLRLVPAAGGAAISLVAGTNDSTASYNGPWGAAVQVAAFEASASGVSASASYTLVDDTSGDSIAVAPGTYADLTMWRPAAPMLSLRIADTRWPDALILRQPDGSEYAIAPQNVQGTWVPTIGNSSTYTFYSFGYFDATTRADSAYDWWAVDLPALASGVPDATSPHQTTDLHLWGAGLPIDSDGDGVSNYDEFVRGTLAFNPDTDGDGVLDGVDAYPLDPLHSTNINGTLMITLTSPPGAILNDTP